MPICSLNSVWNRQSPGQYSPQSMSETARKNTCKSFLCVSETDKIQTDLLPKVVSETNRQNTSQSSPLSRAKYRPIFSLHSVWLQANLLILCYASGFYMLLFVVRCLWCARVRVRARVCVGIHWHCSAQLSMFNMEKRYRNKIIIITIIIIIINVVSETARKYTCQSVPQSSVWNRQSTGQSFPNVVSDYRPIFSSM